MLYYQMTGFMEGDAPPSPMERLHLPDTAEASLFLDFDGTLVDIADRPDGIRIPDRLHGLLARAFDRLDGRVALVSGRTVDELRAFLPRFEGPLIGAHGAERWVEGRMERAGEFDADRIAGLQRLVADFAVLQPAFLVENKPTGVVLHYRQAQEQGALAMHFMESLVAASDGFKLQPALCAYEIKPDGVGKDIALAALLDNPPFAGSRPVFAGDDLTDEPALELVQARKGVGIKIGTAESVARYRLSDPAALMARLETWLA